MKSLSQVIRLAAAGALVVTSVSLGFGALMKNEGIVRR